MRGLIVETSVTIAASAIMAAMVAAGGVAVAYPIVGVSTPEEAAVVTDSDPLVSCIVQDGARFCVHPEFYQALGPGGD